MSERTEKITFENYDRKIEKIEKVLAAYGINGLEDAERICREKGLDPYKIAFFHSLCQNSSF